MPISHRRRPFIVLMVACAWLMASFGNPARADPRVASNIPASEPKSDEPASLEPETELPLPYEPWDGRWPRSAAAGPAGDAGPPPLAQTREWKRRPFELTAAIAALLPSCAAGSIDSRGCTSVHPGAGVDAAFAYRVTPFFAVGIEGVFSGLAGDTGGPLSARGGRARFVGVLGRVYFADTGPWDPYAALTLGVGSLELAMQAETSERGTTTGLGARVGGGIDYSLGSHVRLGPTASFAHFVAWREQHCGAAACRTQNLAHGRLLGFATVGVRVTGSLGDAL